MVRTIGTENEALTKYLGWVDFEFLQKSIICLPNDSANKSSY